MLVGGFAQGVPCVCLPLPYVAATVLKLRGWHMHPPPLAPQRN